MAFRGRVYPAEKGGLVARRARRAAALGLLALAASAAARGETLVVLEARGIGSTAGAKMDSAEHLSLRSGEHVRLIGENGNQYCLDGPYDGPARPPHNAPGARDWLLAFVGSDAGSGVDPLTDCLK